MYATLLCAGIVIVMSEPIVLHIGQLKKVTEDIRKRVEQVCIEDATMVELAQMVARYSEPYVPMQTGTLSTQVQITPGHLVYTAPYAHYQNEGTIYGPNIPIKQNGVIVRWVSPAGHKKHPTGRTMSHTHSMHPLATSHWVERMMEDKGEEVNAEASKIVYRRAKVPIQWQ